eukprot:CAMPEP_0168610412 /NCGR_PEP_ID=MMETSP0449_2-20121227/1770_1 /TAXON_ID=1082188 /ORGANISM="Strombidium rassoulzadegani, Strain ras09" /LENGTH=44 /DNA_ID= /DNA_START= /DNA_END= /DNA_ORIENTATION=
MSQNSGSSESCFDDEYYLEEANYEEELEEDQALLAEQIAQILAN